MSMSEGLMAPLDPIEVLQNAVGPEASFYVEQMRKLEPGSFAVMKVGGEVVEKELGALVNRVTMFSELGLYPVIVHGGSPQINAEVEKRGLEKKKIDGVRVTDRETLECAQIGLGKVNQTLVDALTERGVAAEGLTDGIFTAHFKDKDTYQFTGEVDDVNIKPIKDAARAGKVPIVSCLGADNTGQLLNINGDEAARAAGAALKPHKFIMLTSVPGVLGRDGQVKGVIHGEQEANELIDDQVVDGGMVEKIRKGLSALHDLPEDSSVTITNLEQLLEELFTYEGGGTLLVHEDKIVHLPSVEAVNQKAVGELIEEVFGKQLNEDYFDALPNDTEIYTTDRGHRGVAIVVPNEDTQPAYIDKLAVREDERGHGLGDELVDAVCERHPAGVFLRVRKDNPYALDWYRSPGRLEEYTDLADDTWAVFFSPEVTHNIKELYAKIAISLPPTLMPFGDK